MYYKGYEGKSECEEIALQLEFEKLKCAAKSSKINGKIHLNDFSSQTAVRGLIIGAAMAWFLQLTGCFIIIIYAMLIFKNSYTVLNPHIASIVLATMQIFGGLASTMMSDTFGRKVLLIISLLGSALGLFSFSVYSYLIHVGFDLSNYLALPVVCLSLVIFISNAGIAPLSNVCTVENLPPKVCLHFSLFHMTLFHCFQLFDHLSLILQIRVFGMVLFTLWYNVVAFLCDKYFPILLKMIHLHGCLSIFAVNCCLGTLFVIFFMKETRGQSIDIPEK